jgi:hypothetical protein
MTSRRVKLYRTEAEWAVIDKKIKDAGKANFNAFLRSEINRIKIMYGECRLCVSPADGNKKQKVYCIDEQTYKIFEEISKRMQKPIASVVDDFFIAPLLKP